jgi:four helix bundle protein
MPKEEQDDDEKLFSFEKLEVYNRAVDLADTIINLTKEFPYRVQRTIVPQLNRAALSISLNIAEGCSNYYKNDKKRYLRIARGSVFECIPSIKISKRQQFIDRDTHKDIYNELFEISCMISGLIKSIDKRKDGEWRNENKKESDEN